MGDARLQLGQAQANSAQAARDVQVARMRLVLLRDLPFSGAASTATPVGAPGFAPSGAAGTTNPASSVTRPAGTGTPTGNL